MPITYMKGDIFNSGAQALVNPVNCVGVMGKGLAKQFKERFPDNFTYYAEQCRLGNVKTGKMLVTCGRNKPYFIINFPTKQDWRNCSELSYIILGLNALVKSCEEFGITSIAIPALGCGLGGLNRNAVKALIEATFMDSDISVLVYI